MMLSIIVPLYNVEKVLCRCVSSLQNQIGDSEYEVVIVDDGSTDGSFELCSKLINGDTRFKLYGNEHQGVSAARNFGIHHSSGEYVSFVDPDDYIEPDYVKSLMMNMVSSDLLFFANYSHYDDGRVIIYSRSDDETYINATDAEEFLMQMKFHCYPFETYGYTWNKCFKRSILDDNNISFVNGLSFREDEIFTNEYCRHIYSITYLKKPLYHYCISNNGLASMPQSSETLSVMSKHLDSSTEGIQSVDFYKFEKKKIFDWILTAAMTCRHSHRKYVKDAFNYYSKNKSFIELKSSGVQSLFRYPKMISYPLVLFISVLKK